MEFAHPDILNKLQDGEYAWLTQALLKTRVISTMDENTILGLMMAMTALNGATAGHVAVFVADLTHDVRQKILGLFKSELTKIFPNPEVCKWLTEHLRLMHAESLHLARFLCSKRGVRAYDILQLSRVCEIPP